MESGIQANYDGDETEYEGERAERKQSNSPLLTSSMIVSK